LRELLNVALKAIIETKASVLSYHLFRQLYEKTDEDYERRVLHKYVEFRKVIAYLAVVIFAEASLISSVRRVSERWSLRVRLIHVTSLISLRKWTPLLCNFKERLSIWFG